MREKELDLIENKLKIARNKLQEVNLIVAELNEMGAQAEYTKQSNISESIIIKCKIDI